MMTIKEKWIELEKKMSGGEIPNRSVAVEYKNYSACEIHCTLSNDFRRGLLIRFPPSVVSSDFKKYQYNGFETIFIPSKGDSRYSDLDIIVSDKQYNDIFSTFCEGLVIQILGESEPESTIRKIKEHLILWENFMVDISQTPLTQSQIKGLFGELHFLLTTLIPTIGLGNAVIGWKGPDKKPQDFIFGNIGIEVKTSSDKDKNNIKITNEQQLNITGFSDLYLHYIRLVETGGGNMTLNDMVNLIYDECQGFPDVYQKFSRELIKCNYRDADRHLYENTGFSVDTETTFRVTEDFPCLTRIKYLPEWISDVSYSIKLSYLDDYKIDRNIFLNQILE